MCISGLAAVVNYAISFWLAPYITKKIGIEAYGFVSIAKTAVSYAQIFTVALTTFIVRHIFMAYESGDMDESCSYFSSSLAGCAALAGGIFVLMLPVVAKLEHVLRIPDALVPSVKWLFVATFFNFVLQTLITPFNAAPCIRNRLDLSGVMQLTAYATDAIVLLLLFHGQMPRLWYVGIGAISASTVLLLGSAALTRRLTPELRFDVKGLSANKVFSMLRQGMWDSFNSLGTVLNSGLDLLISNLMLSGVATGQISVAKTIGAMYAGMMQIITQTFQPTMLKAYASEDKASLMHEITKAVKVSGYFSNIVLAGFLALGSLYYSLWMPGEDTAALYGLTLLTLLPGLTTGAVRPIYYVYTMTLKNRLPCMVTIAGGVLNVLSMFLLLRFTHLGAYAVVGTTAFIMIAINLFFNPLYAAHCMHVPARALYRVLIRHVVSAICMAAAFLLIGGLIKPMGWIGLLLTAGLMAGVGLLIHMLAYTRLQAYTESP